MTKEKRRENLQISALAMIIGALSSVTSFMLFFGGSDRDPWWAWALYILFFYGGGLVSLIGLATFFHSAVKRG